MCGEKGRGNGVNLWAGGSPPRVRGKCRPEGRRGHHFGITPACAGKTSVREVVIRQFRDHPRVCGENFEGAEHDAACEGSPPRVRGKRRVRTPRACASGITPACAGKTKITRGRRGVLGDHPRVCGENILHAACDYLGRGSPPRVRGKQFASSACIKGIGITPACAGKTSSPEARRRPDRDHPRVCGENYYGSSTYDTTEGSPPRVRGKRRKGVDYVGSFGITPACAGKTPRD